MTTIFTIKLTPNKADCLSIHGVAREVSALTGAALTLPEMKPVAVHARRQALPVKISAPDLCGRFSRPCDSRRERARRYPGVDEDSAWSALGSAASRRWWTSPTM